MELVCRYIQVPQSIGIAGLDTLEAELNDALATPGRGVVVLTGSAECFCRGMEIETGDYVQLSSQILRFAHYLLDLHACAQPTIALVNGDALGGGLGLAAACDVVIASPNARFGMPEALVGMVPAMILPILAERLTPANARRMALSTVSIDATDAQRFGLVDEISTDFTGTLRRHVRLFLRAAPFSVAWLKQNTPALIESVLMGAETTTARLAASDVVVAREALAKGEAPWKM